MGEPQIRFGILGCAYIARKVGRAIGLAPGAALHAVASRSLDKAASFAAANGFPSQAKLYGSYEALLDDPEIDAVYVPLPTSLHVRWAVAAARKGKHVLLEKPVAPSTAELDEIIAACDESGVQYMDATMWMHHPRTAKMEEFLSDEQCFGKLKEIHTSFTYGAPPDFLKNDIRVKPDLDSLGALGDAGWYCIRAALWATNYEIPKSVIALPGAGYNEAGVILSCGACLYWEDGLSATFRCSFLSHLTMDIIANGTKGTLNVHDYVVPYREDEAPFYTASGAWFFDKLAGWGPKLVQQVVSTGLPQEALMVEEFARLVRRIKADGLKSETIWPSISRKTQLVIDAVKLSIEKGFVPVEVAS